MAYCRNCGKEIPADSQYCSGCGRDLLYEENIGREAEAQKKPISPRAMIGLICLGMACCFVIAPYFKAKDRVTVIAQTASLTSAEGEEPVSFESDGRNIDAASAGSFDQGQAGFTERCTMQETPQSSCFSSVGYDSENEVLHVIFRTSGIEYVYYDFTATDWDSFINAGSLGTYFNNGIKGQFACEKIG